MMNAQQFWWLVYFIIAEFIVVFVFIVGCYISKLYYLIQDSFNKKIAEQIKEILLKNEPIPPHLAQHVSIILHVLRKMKAHSVPDWEQKKIEIVKDYALPQARKYIDKRDWKKRYLLVSCFDYYLSLDDLSLLNQLINDTNAIISFNAMRIASKFGDKELLKSVLFKLNQAPHPFHAFVIRSFSRSPVWGEVIKEELISADDPWIKKICYEILNMIGPTPDFFEVAQADSFNQNNNIRLAAIRVLPHIDRDRYFQVYKKLIHDENWMVRNAIVKTLREIKDTDAIELLADSLNDPVWWVKANAAKTLSLYGEQGQQVLSKFKGTKEIAGYEDAAYLLTIEQTRKKTDHA